jgi:hypothetical protein
MVYEGEYLFQKADGSPDRFKSAFISASTRALCAASSLENWYAPKNTISAAL